MYLLVTVKLIVLEATFEGLEIRKRKTIAGWIEFVFLALVILSAFAWMAGVQFPFIVHYVPLWRVIVGFLLFRFAVFDLIHNFFAGLNINYIGNSKTFDIVMNKIIKKGKIQINLIWFLRFICGFVGVAFLLNIGK